MPPQDHQTHPGYAQPTSPWTEPFRTTYDNQAGQPRPQADGASHPDTRQATYNPLDEVYNPAR